MGGANGTAGSPIRSLRYTIPLEPDAEGINLDTVGIILMIVGSVGLVVSMLFWSSFGPYSRERRGTIVRETRSP